MLAVVQQSVDLEYDDRFMFIDQLINEHEADFDAPLRKGQEPFDWGRVASDCEKLAQASSDLRVAIWWLRAQAEVGGLNAWVDALLYIQALLELPEESVYPRGDADISSGELHATALRWLSSSKSLALFRKLPLTPDAQWLIAVLLPNAVDAKGLSEVEQGKLREALLGNLTHTESVLGRLVAAKAAVSKIAQRLEERFVDGGGDFSELIAMVGHAIHKLEPLIFQTISPGLDEPSVVVESTDLKRSNIQTKLSLDSKDGFSIGLDKGLFIQSRDEVYLLLAALERYYITYESGHPAPIFIQKLQRMVDMNFDALMRELFSESEKLMGRLIKPVSE